MRQRLAVGALFAVVASGCAAPVNVTVHALDAKGTPVPAAQLEVVGEGLKAAFDQKGQVVLSNVRVHGATAFKLSANGFETAFRSVDLIAGTSNDFVVHMRPAGAVHHITLPPVGQKIVVNEGISALGITGGGLKHKDGSDVTGDVDVQMTPYDPIMMEEAPATMKTVDGRGLISAGMSTITITQNGEELQPKDGQPLEWTMQVNPALQFLTKHENMRMFYVDETKGLWVNDTTASVQWDAKYGSWTAKLPHLTIWNGDFWFFTGGCLTGTIKDAHGNLVTTGASASALDVSVGDNEYGVCGDGNCDVRPWSGSSPYGVSQNQYVLTGGHSYVPCNASDPDCDADGYKSIASQAPVAIPNGGFFIGIPAAEAGGGYDGAGCLPVDLSISLPSLPGQSVAAVTLNGSNVGTSLTISSFQTPEAASCSEIDVQLCLADGQSCSSGDKCCDGSACGSDGKCGGAQCVADGQTCQSGVACCDGQACNAQGKCGAPTCVADGFSCSATLPCCDGQACNVQGHCGAPTCLGTSASCYSTSQCCTGTCYSGLCLDCSDSGSGCSANADCCGNNHCVQPASGASPSGPDHTCQACIPQGHGTCNSAGDCCGGSPCVGGVCVSCVPAGQSASLGSCCSGLCPVNGVCTAAGGPQASCTTGSDCCSGQCSDQFCL